MLYPDYETLHGLSGQGNLFPVWREITGDTETPVGAFLKLAGMPSFLLESVEGGEKWARYSFIGIDPVCIFTFADGKGMLEIRRNAGFPLPCSGLLPAHAGDPLNVLADILARFYPVQIEGLPRFTGGFVGYVGYDTVKCFERVPDSGKPGIGLPDVFMMLCDTLLVFDNFSQTIRIVANIFSDGPVTPSAFRSAENRIDEIVASLQKPVHGGRLFDVPMKKRETLDLGSLRFQSNMDRETFTGSVEKAREYVAAGDIFQVVLSQRFSYRSDTDPFDIYRALRVINPSPYMYFFQTSDFRIAGSSPEILVRMEDDVVTVRPIAGTRRRGATVEEDARLETELRNDPKECAEHIMLVDLGRNDVGRIAEIGTVRVTDLMNVERYSHVMHLVSHVQGKKRANMNAFDVFRACFPAGTVSGAPKVRAMEIIEELEPHRRGLYAGAVGYFGFSGSMDFCIAIRTLIMKDGMIFAQAGAGIVADSVPEAEYQETVSKAMAMSDAAGFFGGTPACF